VLSFSIGHSIDYLTESVAAGREAYYSDAVAAGEPPGVWSGLGATALGLAGEVNAEVIAGLYGQFLDPRDGETVLGNARRNYSKAEELYARKLEANPHASAEERELMRVSAGKEARETVAFYDATFSPPKSVTVLFFAFEAQEMQARARGDLDAALQWAAHRRAVEDAVRVGSAASVDYLARHGGYTRTGHHGPASGTWQDAHAWTVASFFQHDSRNHDPQLHIHNAILNKVQGPDGKWRAIDWDAVKLHKGAAGAIGDRVMFERLVSTLGVTVAERPDGQAREIVGVDQRVIDLFSSRTRAITPKTAQLVERFEAQRGRAPNALELYRLSKVATLATRPGKEHAGETVDERLARWDRMVRETSDGLLADVDSGLAGVAWAALRAADREQVAGEFDPKAVREMAVAKAQAVQSRFHEADVIRAVDSALPDYLGGLTAAEVEELVSGLAGEGIGEHCSKLTAEAPGAATLPDAERLANGLSSHQRPGTELYASNDHLRSERAIRAASVERGATATNAELAAFFTASLTETGFVLAKDQAAAIEGILTSGAYVESLVGPAGTGKTRVVGAVARAWTDPGLWGGARQRCFGLATAQIATEELAEVGLTARNVTAWLNAQERLAGGGTNPADQGLALRAGDLVVLDESSMANTPAVAAIREHVHAAGAKLLLAGDHRQLAAVGAGGAMSMVEATGISYRLTEPRRFTHEWEAAAGLRLREGDVSALVEYRKHGRIVDGGTYADAAGAAVKGYLADYLTGRDTRLLVDTNDQAAEVSARVRAELVELGKVTEHGVTLGRQGTTAGVGDLVEARRLAWELAGHEGNRRGPVTREQYRVLGVRADGGLDVAHVAGHGADGEQLGDRLVLPAEYVAKDLALGYASTVHSVEGTTVDTSHSVATSNTGRSAQYVEMTRGRDSNTAYVQTIADATDVRPGQTIERVDPLAVLDRSHEDGSGDRAALVEAEESSREMRSVRTAMERLAEVAERQAVGRTEALLDHLLDRDVISESQRMALTLDENTATLSRVLRQAEVAGHDPLDVLTGAVVERELGNARSIASVLHHRITDRVDLDPAGDSPADWVPKVADPAYQQHLDDLAQAAHHRRDELGEQAAQEGPQWAVEAFGLVPDGRDERAEWVERAGVVAAHREHAAHTDDAVALPGAPPRQRVEEYASWRASYRALGCPEDTREEWELSDGALRVQVRAYERELAWAPPYVAKDAGGTARAAEDAQADATLLGVRAEVSDDQTERTRLAGEAAAADARAVVLQEQAAALLAADNVRAEWFVHTAVTRYHADRARLELASRGIDPDSADERVTAEEWLTAHREERAVEEPLQVVTDADVDELAVERETPVEERPVMVAEIPVPDIRGAAAGDPAFDENSEGWTRVPDVDTTRQAVEEAHRALEEMAQRVAWEAAREAEEHAGRLGQWHAADQALADAEATEDHPVASWEW
jgi:conjugative relaxase-like TrwC/TraI family protein